MNKYNFVELKKIDSDTWQFITTDNKCGKHFFVKVINKLGEIVMYKEVTKELGNHFYKRCRTQGYTR